LCSSVVKNASIFRINSTKPPAGGPVSEIVEIVLSLIESTESPVEVVESLKSEVLSMPTEVLSMSKEVVEAAVMVVARGFPKIEMLLGVFDLSMLMVPKLQ